MNKIFVYIFLIFTSFLSANGINKTFLVYGGKNGWIGQKIVKYLKDFGHNPVCAQSRLENREELIKEIEKTKPDFIINAAGITGRPNVDWCETHKEETLRTNVIGTLNLADVAYLNNIHMTNLSTGCIYQYDEKHPINSGKGFTEEDEPNFKESFYSKTKILLEKLILEYPNVLNLRVKMPVSDDLHPRSFVGKIIGYKKLINIPNSLCVLEDLLPIAIDMTVKKINGNYNFVNPGSLSHNEVLDLYKEYIEPNFKYENFSLEEQAKILKVGRSNCELSAAKLLKEFPGIPNIKDSLKLLFERYKKNQNILRNPENKKVLIMTHNYNQPDFIYLQDMTFKKFLKDNYEFVVFNDAPDEKTSKLICDVCKNCNVKCVNIPQNIHNLWPSCRPLTNTTSPSNVRHVHAIKYSLDLMGFDHNGIVMFIDSDMFLVRPFNINEFMKDLDIASVYKGASDDKKSVGYLVPLLTMLNMSKLPDKRTLDFSCGEANGFLLDTGGLTYYYLKNHPNLKTYWFDEFYGWQLFCPEEYAKHREDKTTPVTQQIQKLKSLGFNDKEIKFLQKKPSTFSYQFNNNFFHFRGGSNYDNFSKDFMSKKMKLVSDYIYDILND